jgi:hypothetical protein
MMCELFPEAKIGHVMTYEGASSRVKQIVVERIEREANQPSQDLETKLPWLKDLKDA